MIPQTAFDAAVTRLQVALTSGQADRYDPRLLMAQLMSDIGQPVPTQWWDGSPEPEPEPPTACDNCGMSYRDCTTRVLSRKGGGKACCPTCGINVTHNQNAWEAWDQARRRAI